MQGFIHLLLEAYVSETVGSQHLRPIRQIAGIPGPPLADQHYPDELTTRLLYAIAEYQSAPLDDVLYQFGVYFMCAPLMHQYYRVFLEGHPSARHFLEQVPAIHRHLERSLPQAHLPHLRCIAHSPTLLEVIYESPRHLCPLLRGILEGVGHYFHETLEVREMECQRRGAAACRLLVSFVAAQRSDSLAEVYAPGATRMSGPQNLGGPLPAYPYSPEEAVQETKRQRDEEEDILILYALSSSQAEPAQSLRPGAAPEPLYLPLTLFEIARWLTAQGVAAEYARLSLLQRSLSRLAVQGFVESKLDPYSGRQDISSSAAALGGQGLLAARRYRITSAGQAWLQDMQHRQEY